MALLIGVFALFTPWLLGGGPLSGVVCTLLALRVNRLLETRD
ncbi:membrane transport protein [Bordetella pertussis]|nr:membrane transport protein [Bordetella pertussis]